MKLALLFLALTCLSWLLTGVARHYALAHRLIDSPNVRSSHNVPTPRGGGVSIVLTVLCGLPVLAVMGLLTLPTMAGYLGAGASVAIIGFMDDHGHVAVPYRLIVHVAAAIWLLLWLAPIVDWIGYALAAGCLVWLTNLYNFMDGIDSIASVEAVTVCIAGSVFYAVVDPGGAHWVVPLMIAAAVAGFLPWNIPPARIFMGDAGSGFIGIMLGAIVIEALTVADRLFWAWLLLLGCFVVDATLTLLRRALRGEKVYEAHRGHAYQVASRDFNSHGWVAISVGLINLLWLFPIGLMVGLGIMNGVLGLIIGWAPLVAVGTYFTVDRDHGRRLIR